MYHKGMEIIPDRFSVYTGTQISFLHAIIAQEMKFFVKDFFSKCDQIHRKLRIWSHLLKNSFMENFIFCAVYRIAFHNDFF